MTDSPATTRRAEDPDQRYRLYIDESGDHVFRRLDEINHRYLCLLGCWFRMADYRPFHDALEQFKQTHIPHNPDEPLVLHREDILNRRGSFWRLRDEETRRAFDEGLLEVMGNARFTLVGVVIDKLTLQDRYPTPAHPYHLALGFLLQRYCGLLNHINRCGDVMAESRGGREDKELKKSYEWIYERGVFGQNKPAFFQKALTSRQLKLKQKSANIAGLQLADLIGHPLRLEILRRSGHAHVPAAPFAARVLDVVGPKLNRHLYTGRVEGYGTVLFPL